MIFELQFESLAELFWMNGHGPYVWAAYGLAALAVAMMIWSPLEARKRFFKEMRSAAQRQQMAGEAETDTPS